MDHYKEQIIYVIQNDLKPDPEISDDWKKYSSTGELKSAEQLNAVEPFLDRFFAGYDLNVVDFFNQNIFAISALLLALATVLCVLSSIIAVRRYLKR